MKFSPRLITAAELETFAGGYSSGDIRPDSIADDLYQRELNGAWLTCYMLRRFGWPNMGSDDYKELCRWAITTPVPGLWLTVAPHMGGGHDGYVMNLHFGLIFDKATGEKLARDPGRERFWKRQAAAMQAWWSEKGSKLYALGESKPDEDELVHEYGKIEGMTFGLWRRPKGMRRQKALPDDAMLFWWLRGFLEKTHPKVKLPKMTRAERRHTSGFKRRCESAIRSTLRELLRPTYVRDVRFNPNGYREGMGKVAERWAGAGYTPEYWFTKREQPARESTDP